MHALLLFMLLAAPEKTRFGQSPSPGKPADYTIGIHVQASRLINECYSSNTGSSCSLVQHLSAVIDGKRFDLDRSVDVNMFRTGDYKARIVDETHPRAEEYTRIYEILLSDGKVARFAVAGEYE